MRVILFFLLLFSNTLFANTKIVYDRNNIELEQILSKIVFNIDSVTTKPVLNQSKGLYQIKNFDDVSLATTLSVTLDAINNRDASKIDNYTLVSPLATQQIHIVVSKTSRFKTIYDLNKRNVDVGIEENAMDYFTLSLSSAFNLKFNNQYNDVDRAIFSMINGAGIDAVIFSDKVPSSYLSKYKEYVRLINIPSMRGFKQTIINKDIYKQKNDTISVESDMLLICKNEYAQTNPAEINKMIDNIFKNPKIDKNAICNKNYVIKTAPYQIMACGNFIKLQKEAKEAKKPKSVKKPSLNLIKKIESVEDIQVYNYALVKNKNFGGLNKKTELKKLNQLVKLYKDEEASKIIIKSYSSDGNAYQAGQKVFKLLKKKGISRSNMIVKSFNENRCNDKSDTTCIYLNSKVLFEFI